MLFKLKYNVFVFFVDPLIKIKIKIKINFKFLIIIGCVVFLIFFVEYASL